MLFLGCPRDDVRRKAIMVVLVTTENLFLRFLKFYFVVIVRDVNTSVTKRVTRGFKVTVDPTKTRSMEVSDL